MRVLLTGFGPFPGAPFNPSAALIERLVLRRRPALAGIEYTTHVFATTYASVDHDLPKLFAWRPDIVLMFGLAGGRRQLCIEMQARNAVSVLYPDASGFRPQEGMIERGAPSSRKGRAPFGHLVGALRASGVPSRVSRDAGGYLCNYAYWRALERARGGRPLVQFVHIPPISSNPRPRRRRRRRLPSLLKLVGAAEMLLIALVAAGRR